MRGIAARVWETAENRRGGVPCYRFAPRFPRLRHAPTACAAASDDSSAGGFCLQLALLYHDSVSGVNHACGMVHDRNLVQIGDSLPGIEAKQNHGRLTKSDVLF